MENTMIILCLALVSWGASAQMDHSNVGHSGNSHSKMDSKMIEKATVILRPTSSINEND